jgi:hypothetical protein
VGGLVVEGCRRRQWQALWRKTKYYSLGFAFGSERGDSHM